MEPTTLNVYYKFSRILAVPLLTGLLIACGGGGSSPTPAKDSEQSPTSNPNSSNPHHSTSPDTNSGHTKKPEIIDPNQEKIEDDKVEGDGTLLPNTTSPDAHTLSINEIAVYNRLNTRRMACGFGSLSSNKELTKAADNHAKYLAYMSQNSSLPFQGHEEKEVDKFSGLNNPYFSGFNIADRTNTLTNIGKKAQAVNYDYKLVAENLTYLRFNEAYFNKYGDNKIALTNINSLLAAPYHMVSLLSPSLTEVGLSYNRNKIKQPFELSTGQRIEGQGSILVVVSGTPLSEKARKPTDTVVSYPCDGTVGTQYILTHESPNPFGENGRNLNINPIGQPIYILGQGPISVTNYKMTDAAGKELPLKALTAENDINHIILPSQVILIPLISLRPDQSYRVTYSVSVNGSNAQNKSMVFRTKKAI